MITVGDCGVGSGCVSGGIEVLVTGKRANGACI